MAFARMALNAHRFGTPAAIVISSLVPVGNHRSSRNSNLRGMHGNRWTWADPTPIVNCEECILKGPKKKTKHSEPLLPGAPHTFQETVQMFQQNARTAETLDELQRNIDRARVSNTVEAGAKAFEQDKHLGPMSNTNPKVGKGFAAEHWHSTTYNCDAAMKGHAEVSHVPKSTQSGSADIVVSDGTQAQLKYGGKSYVQRGFADDRYDGQQKIMPADYEGEHMSGGQTAVEAGGAKSIPLTNGAAEKLASCTGAEFAEKVSDAVETKLQQPSRPVSFTHSVAVHQGQIADETPLVGGARVTVSRTVTLSSDITAKIGLDSQLTKDIGSVEVHAGCNVQTDLLNGAAVGVSAGASKELASCTSADGKTAASVGVSGSASVTAGLDFQNAKVGINCGARVAVHGQVSSQVADNLSIGAHGSAGVSTRGLEASVGGHKTTTEDSILTRTSETIAGTAHFTDCVPTNVSYTSVKHESGLVCSKSSTSKTNIGLSGIGSATTTNEQGVFVDEATETTKNLFGKDKEAVTRQPSAHVQNAFGAMATTAACEIAEKGVSAELAQNVAVVGGESMARSLTAKALGTIGDNSALAAAGADMLVGLASDVVNSDKSSEEIILDGCRRGAKSALTVVAVESLGAMVDQGPAELAVIARAAAAIPDVAERLWNDDPAGAFEVVKDTTVRSTGTFAGAKVGATVCAGGGPPAVMICAMVGGALGSKFSEQCWQKM